MIRRKQPRGFFANTSIIPLVDVLIVLLFFFLMSFSFRQVKLLNISLPQVETAGQNGASSFNIVTINKDGDLFYNQTAVEFSKLEETFGLLASLNPDQEILIAADKSTQLENVTSVMDAARKAKLETIRLQTL